MPDLPRPLDDIERHVGRFALSCGELEWVAYRAIFQLEQDKDKAKNLADTDFAERVKALLKLSKLHLPRNAERREWLTLWERVTSLIQNRNIILHNPILMDVLENAAGEVQFGGIRIHVVRKRRPQTQVLSPKFIRREAEKAQKYNDAVLRLWSKLFPDGYLSDD